MAYIIRIQPDELTEMILRSESEEEQESPLEIFDNNGDDTPKKLTYAIEIDEKDDEKHFENRKQKNILKDISKTKGREKENGESNSKGHKGDKGQTGLYPS